MIHLTMLIHSHPYGDSGRQRVNSSWHFTRTGTQTQDENDPRWIGWPAWQQSCEYNSVNSLTHSMDSPETGVTSTSHDSKQVSFTSEWNHLCDPAPPSRQKTI